jgi:nuclear pore complex protein Nup62
MYVDLYVCMYVYMLCVCMYVYVLCMYVYCVCMYVYIYIYIYVCMYVCMYVCICVCVRIHVSMYVCMYRSFIFFASGFTYAVALNNLHLRSCFPRADGLKINHKSKQNTEQTTC